MKFAPEQPMIPTFDWAELHVRVLSVYVTADFPQAAPQNGYAQPGEKHRLGRVVCSLCKSDFMVIST
jgi:hypothetical protein